MGGRGGEKERNIRNRNCYRINNHDTTKKEKKKKKIHGETEAVGGGQGMIHLFNLSSRQPV